MLTDGCQLSIPLGDYDLDATLSSGQAFRWRRHNGAWIGIVANRWVQLRSQSSVLTIEASAPPANWNWITNYLQTGVDLSAIVATFPEDDAMRQSVTACRGLRLLRQEPWECLASFICSSTKQIVQIQQIVELLCRRFGEPVPVPAGSPVQFGFPTATTIASLAESDLRACKMGFRAPYLLAAARAVAGDRLNLDRLQSLSCPEARRALTELPGVGEKIANCVLLFAYGMQAAFPVDVWVMKALRQLYFPKRRPSPARLRAFVDSHFGPNAGYAQQYLFHYMRTRRQTAPGERVNDGQKPGLARKSIESSGPIHSNDRRTI